MGCTINYCQFNSNFNRSPETTRSFTNTQTQAISFPGSTADAQAGVFSRFSQPFPAQAQQASVSQASGQGNQYFSRANGVATNRGDFQVQGEFRFDFQAALGSKTQVTPSQNSAGSEAATSQGKISFRIFDRRQPTTPIDQFTVTQNRSVNPTSGNSEFTFQASPGIRITSGQFKTQFDLTDGTNVATTQSIVQGFYSRSFDENTSLFVESLTETDGAAQAPEPTVVVTIPVGILVGLRVLRKRQMNRFK